MSLTELTVLFSFHTFWMVLFLFCHVVITLFTFCACQCDFYAHDFHLHVSFIAGRFTSLPLQRFLVYRDKSFFILCFRHKKKDPLPLSLFQSNIDAGLCQLLYFLLTLILFFIFRNCFTDFVVILTYFLYLFCTWHNISGT